MRRLLRQLDLTCAVMGLLVMVIAVALLVYRSLHPIYLVAVGIGITCVLLYLVFRNRIGEEGEPDRNPPHFNLYTGTAVLLLVAGILVYVFRPEQYVKPLVYYILLAMATGAAVWRFITQEYAWRGNDWVLVLAGALCSGASIYVEHLGSNKGSNKGSGKDG